MRAHHAHVAIHTYKCTRVVLPYTCGGEGVAVHIHMHVDALECDQSVRLCVHSSDARARASVLVNFCLNN